MGHLGEPWGSRGVPGDPWGDLGGSQWHPGGAPGGAAPQAWGCAQAVCWGLRKLRGRPQGGRGPRGVGHETDERPAAVRSLVYFLLCSPSQPRRRWRRERSPSSQGRVGRGSSSPAPSVCNSCTNLASHRRKIRASWRAALGARNPATNRNRGGAAERARRHTRLPGKLFQSIERSRAANFLTSKRDFFRAWGPFSSVVRTQRSSRRRYPYERTETM